MSDGQEDRSERGSVDASDESGVEMQPKLGGSSVQHLIRDCAIDETLSNQTEQLRVSWPARD